MSDKCSRSYWYQ